MKNILITLAAIVAFSACAQKAATDVRNEFPEAEKVKKSESQWKNELSEAEFYILREKGTERAFTSPLNSNKEEGTYLCAACKLPLFESTTKFKSGSGWPSFYEPINDVNVAEADDRSYGMVRTEVLCARCDGHLGHVFADGPQPTGLRYCINGIALDFEKKKE